MDADEYQVLADCIRSGQVPEVAVVEIMRENPGFEQWYRDRYLTPRESRPRPEDDGVDTASQKAPEA